MSNDLLQAVSAAVIAVMFAATLSGFAMPRFNSLQWAVVFMAALEVGVFWKAVMPAIAVLLTAARFWDWKGRDLAAKYWPWG